MIFLFFRPLPKVQWYFNDKPLVIGNVDGYVLTIQRMKYKDVGKYHCELRNPGDWNIDKRVTGDPIYVGVSNGKH